MNARHLLLLVLILAGAGGGYWWLYLRNPVSGPLVLQGNVEVRQVNLGFKVAGRIEKLDVDEGDAVSPGQALASLEKVYFDDALAQARAQREQMTANFEKLRAGNRPEEIAEAKALVAEREATLTNARFILTRAQTLMNSPAGSQKALDDAQAAERQADAPASIPRARHCAFRRRASARKTSRLARAQLDERAAAVKVAERNLADADLIAPSKGHGVEPRARGRRHRRRRAKRSMC